MKNIGMLIVFFAIAGCQPDVQESSATSPAPVSMPGVRTDNSAAAIPPESPKEPAEVAAVPSRVTPVQAKAAPEKTVVEPKVVIAPSVEAAVEKVEPAKIEMTVVAEPAPAPMVAPQVQLSEVDAMALAKKKNCFACHALDKKAVGPSWRAVAEKYRGDAGAQAALESKVRKGGKGNWGSMAMPPQPSLSGEELTGLVQFVLQLK